MGFGQRAVSAHSSSPSRSRSRPAPSEAIAPVLLLLVKQIARDVAESMLENAILSGLEGMGCKGIALANALRALDLRRGSGGAALGMLGAARLPRGAAPFCLRVCPPCPA
jgi:hypothetical protein